MKKPKNFAIIRKRTKPKATVPSKSELQWAKLACEHASRLRQIAEITALAKKRLSFASKRSNLCMADFIFENDAHEIHRLATGGKP